MKHPRPVVAALVCLAGTLLVGSSAGASSPEPAPSTVPVVQTASTTPREFVAPLYRVPTPAPAGTPGPAGEAGVLGPDTVVTPGPVAPRLAPKAEFRPA